MERMIKLKELPIYRKEIANGVFFNSYTDSKFKFNRISVMFLTSLSRERAALNALIPSLISKTNEKLNTMAKLNRKLSGLYASELNPVINKDGDLQYAGLEIATIDNRFAIDGEDIISEAVGLLNDCLFAPYFVDGVFPAQSVEIEKNNQITDNNAEINNKTYYAHRKAIAALFEGEPAAISNLGENEDIEKITPAEATEVYRDILKNMQVEIICTGYNDFKSAEADFKKSFGSIERTPKERQVNTVSPLKRGVKRITETLEIEQSKLVIGYKSDFRNEVALIVMSQLYGGSVTSKLFRIVREKMSLCYYCYSRLGYSKGIMTVECGVDNDNIEKAEAECKKQLEGVVNGNFTDEDIEKVKRSIINSYRAINDSAGGIANWYFHRILKNDIVTPEEVIERFNEVTREQIIEAAASMKLDTVYILTSPEKEEK